MALENERSVLLISGSRKADERMLSYACELAEFYAERNFSIMVGDCPLGVDAMIHKFCADLLILNKLEFFLYVVGFNGKLRVKLPQNPRILPIDNIFFSDTITKYDFLKRDRWMAEHCDLAIGIWNGQDRAHSGTCHTISYAKDFGKPYYLFNFETLEVESN